jgi:hypothetical protein
MIKKPLLSIFVVMLSAIVLSGCLHNPSAPQTTNEVMSEWEKVGKAIAEGKSARCEMINKETGEKSDYYIDGLKMRFETINETNPDQSGAFLTDGEYAYTWTHNNKQGVKFALIDPEETEPQTTPDTDVPDFSNPEEWENYEDMGFTIMCEIEPVDESMFMPPADVQFTDMSETNAQLQKMMENAENMDESNQPSQEEIQRLMETYGN